eukprot:COSAG06_NODE_26580_length_611_cov_3.146484_2_plen_23_part_01
MLQTTEGVSPVVALISAEKRDDG